VLQIALPMTPFQSDPNLFERPRWQRRLWLAAGWLSLFMGVVGLFLPLLPTTPFVLLAAACFSRGSARWDAWLLAHPRFGPVVRDWRAQRCVPLRAKRLAIGMMTLSSALSWWWMPRLYWVPAACCALVGWWLWHLPSAPGAGSAPQGLGNAAGSSSSGNRERV
jgi:uncharacterized protein